MTEISKLSGQEHNLHIMEATRVYMLQSIKGSLLFAL